jgi:hypothetical protein
MADGVNAPRSGPHAEVSEVHENHPTIVHHSESRIAQHQHRQILGARRIVNASSTPQAMPSPAFVTDCRKAHSIASNAWIA